MKKPVVVLTVGFLLSGLSYTNAQRCGTTEYYHMRKQADPSVQLRQDQAEQITQEWINSKTVTLPSIPGFIPSGDHQKDVKAYSAAKKNLVIAIPALKQVAAPADVEKARREKRKNNEFVYRKGGAK